MGKGRVRKEKEGKGRERKGRKEGEKDKTELMKSEEGGISRKQAYSKSKKEIQEKRKGEERMSKK